MEEPEILSLISSPITKVDRSTTELVRIYQLKLEAHVVGKKFRSGAYDDRNDDHVALVDETGSESMSGKSRPPDQHIAIARGNQPTHGVRIEFALETSP